MRRRVAAAVILGALYLVVTQVTPAVAATGTAPQPQLSWGFLWLFPAILLVGLVASRLVLANTSTNFRTESPGIAGTWSFGDSWATNVTAFGAIMTTLFASSDVANHFLGQRADGAIEFSTVGSIVALGFIAASPLLLMACVAESGNNTAGGLLLAASTLVTGGLGELIIDARALSPFGVGYDIHMVWVGALVAALVLVVYAVRTATVTLERTSAPTVVAGGAPARAGLL